MTENPFDRSWSDKNLKMVAGLNEAVTMLPMPPDRTEVRVVGNWDKSVTKTTTTMPEKTVIDYRSELPMETDPNGKSLNEPGAKGDAGKLLPALVLGDFARALIQVSEVGTYGAKKYTAHGWLTVANGIERYDEAMMRHWLKEKAGEDKDPDTGLLHQAHLAWNALARLDLMLREREVTALDADLVKLDLKLREASKESGVSQTTSDLLCEIEALRESVRKMQAKQ